MCVVLCLVCVTRRVPLADTPGGTLRPCITALAPCVRTKTLPGLWRPQNLSSLRGLQTSITQPDRPKTKSNWHLFRQHRPRALLSSLLAQSVFLDSRIIYLVADKPLPTKGMKLQGSMKSTVQASRTGPSLFSHRHRHRPSSELGFLPRMLPNPAPTRKLPLSCACAFVGEKLESTAATPSCSPLSRASTAMDDLHTTPGTIPWKGKSKSLQLADEPLLIAPPPETDLPCLPRWT